MYIKRIMPALSALALLFSMSIALAQDTAKKGDIAQVVTITPKEGQGKALEAAITEYHHFMGTKPGAMRWQWYKVVTGKDTGKYVARTGDHEWADFDATHDWDDESDAKFASLVMPHIAGADFKLTRMAKELGIWPDSLEGYNYFSVTRLYVKTGRFGDFNEDLKKIDDTLKANNFPYPYAFVYTVSGGEGDTVSLVIPYKNYADMAPKKPDYIEVLNKAMGMDEARKFMADFGTTYKVGDNFLLHYLPEQSDYGDGK